jgi:hypothetical protein
MARTTDSQHQDSTSWTVNGKSVETLASAWATASAAFRPGRPVYVRVKR